MSIVVSTGIGGGFVHDGRLAAGASGNAGHLGQTHALRHARSRRSRRARRASPGRRHRAGADRPARSSGRPRHPATRLRARPSSGRRGPSDALADAATLVDLEVIAIGGGFSHVSTDYVDLVGAALRETAVLPYAAATRVAERAGGRRSPDRRRRARAAVGPYPTHTPSGTRGGCGVPRSHHSMLYQRARYAASTIASSGRSHRLLMVATGS